MPNLLALSSSLVWGVSDYVGGSITKRAPAQVVVLWSQSIGFLVAIAGASIIGGRLDLVSAVWGAAAGIGGGVALVSFYQGLATGRMAVVAPVASLVGASLPVGVGQVAVGEVGPLEVGAFEAGAVERAAEQVGVGEIDAVQQALVHVDVVEALASEIAVPEVGLGPWGFAVAPWQPLGLDAGGSGQDG